MSSEEAETVAMLRRRLASMRRGKKGRPIGKVLEELGRLPVKPRRTR